MGIRGLQTFIEDKCSIACPVVSLRQLAIDHRNEFNVPTPVILVDGNALYFSLYTPDLEMIYGGQGTQFTKKLSHFIGRFQAIGVKLVVFFDGTVTTQKRAEWVKRRLEECRKVKEAFAFIKRNETNKKKVNYSFLIERGAPACFSTTGKSIFNELGVEIHQTCKEADEEIVEYANRNVEVMGIIAQDTDFIIYDTKKYFSLHHLDIASMETVLYDRSCFAKSYLNLAVTQLPLFACLNGNDYIPRERLKNFHGRLAHKNKTHLAAIAKNLSTLIREQEWTGNPDNFVEMENISEVVFGHKNSRNLFHFALKSYSSNNVTEQSKFAVGINPVLEKEVYDRHCKGVNNSFLFNILCNRQIGCSTVYEDTTKVVSAALIYRKVRQRMYSVIFSGEDIEVQEWVAYIGNKLKAPEFIKPAQMTNEIFSKEPTLENVWFKYSEKDRKMLLLCILNVPLSLELLSTVPTDRVVFVCLLNYLIGSADHDPLLKPWEVAVFVGQCLIEKNIAYLEKLRVPWTDGDAINISTLFACGVALVSNLLDVCSHPFPPSCAIPSSFFDGKLFHYFYIQAKEKALVKQLCSNQVHLIKEFYKLLNIVTSNTTYAFGILDWKSVLADFDCAEMQNL